MSIVSLAAVATERFMAMMKPHKWRDISIKRKVICAICIWLYSFGVCCPPIFGVGKYVAGGFLTTCCFDYIDKSVNTKVFICYLFFFGLVVPMSVIIYTYVRIWMAVKANEKRKNKEEMDEADLSMFTAC